MLEFRRLQTFTEVAGIDDMMARYTIEITITSLDRYTAKKNGIVQLSDSTSLQTLDDSIGVLSSLSLTTQVTGESLQR